MTTDEYESKIAEAYQVIGMLLDTLGVFESDDGQRALDYFSTADTYDENFLPWPKGDHAQWQKAAQVKTAGTLVAKANKLVQLMDEAETQHGGLVGSVTLRAKNELRLELSKWR
jgi:hypothetical protein